MKENQTKMHRKTDPVLLIDVIEAFSANLKRLSGRQRENLTFSSFGSLDAGCMRESD
jgi:hypothetical protein